jgi:spatacsin
MSLLARAGLIFNISRKFPTIEVHKKFPDLELSDIESGEPHKDTVQAVHGLVLRYCVHYNLPNLLDIYLDHHSLAADNTSMSLMRAVVGGCQWAQWLLLSRIKGCEYEASFFNARLNISQNVTPGRNLGVPEMEGLIPTVDDMAEGGEMAALATLMYAPLPLQKCLCTGSVSRHRRTSSQCTIENLRPALQNFPTLWRSLLAVCFGQDACSIPASPSAKNVNLAVCKYGLFEYLNWREGLFASAGGDTSLLQMMPRWFPKGVRRLLQLSVQACGFGCTFCNKNGSSLWKIGVEKTESPNANS